MRKTRNLTSIRVMNTIHAGSDSSHEPNFRQRRQCRPQSLFSEIASYWAAWYRRSVIYARMLGRETMWNKLTGFIKTLTKIRYRKKISIWIQISRKKRLKTKIYVRLQTKKQKFSNKLRNKIDAHTKKTKNYFQTKKTKNYVQIKKTKIYAQTKNQISKYQKFISVWCI